MIWMTRGEKLTASA
jgi:hypothetical protein